MSMLGLPAYNGASLCWRETRIVYLHGELVLDEHERELREEGVALEEIARRLCKLRSDLRSWTRTLMSDRREAAKLDTEDPNPTFDELVIKWENRGVRGDERYERIIKAAKASRATVNKLLNLQPTELPPLPKVLPSSPTDAAPCPTGAACCLHNFAA